MSHIYELPYILVKKGSISHSIYFRCSGIHIWGQNYPLHNDVIVQTAVIVSGARMVLISPSIQDQGIGIS